MELSSINQWFRSECISYLKGKFPELKTEDYTTNELKELCKNIMRGKTTWEIKKGV